MTGGEKLLAGAGVAALIASGVLAGIARPYEPFLIAAVAMLVLTAFGRTMRRLVVSTTSLTIEREPTAVDAVEQVLAQGQPVDLKLAISTGIPMGRAEVQMGSDHVVQLTAINVSDKPIGVQSIGLRYTNGKWSPFIRTVPYDGNIALPAILQPQQSATVFNDKRGLVAVMTEEGLEIKEIVASLADGSERTASIPDDWRRLRRESEGE